MQWVFLKEFVLLRSNTDESGIVVESSGRNISSRHCSRAPIISCHDNKRTSSEFQQCVSNRWPDPRFSLPPSLPRHFRLMCPCPGLLPQALAGSNPLIMRLLNSRQEKKTRGKGLFLTTFSLLIPTFAHKHLYFLDLTVKNTLVPFVLKGLIYCCCGLKWSYFNYVVV